MTAVEFTAQVEAARGGGAYVRLPGDVLTGLGGGGRFRVTGTANAVPFESSTMPQGGGRVCLGLHKATRQAAGLEIGDDVLLVVERDDRPRVLLVPEDLAAALARDEAAHAAFDKLSFSHRREYVEWVAGAKREETRARRIAQTLDRLRA